MKSRSSEGAGIAPTRRVVDVAAAPWPPMMGVRVVVDEKIGEKRNPAPVEWNPGRRRTQLHKTVDGFGEFG